MDPGHGRSGALCLSWFGGFLCRSERWKASNFGEREVPRIRAPSRSMRSSRLTLITMMATWSMSRSFLGTLFGYGFPTFCSDAVGALVRCYPHAARRPRWLRARRNTEGGSARTI